MSDNNGYNRPQIEPTEIMDDRLDDENESHNQSLEGLSFNDTINSSNNSNNNSLMETDEKDKKLDSINSDMNLNNDDSMQKDEVLTVGDLSDQTVMYNNDKNTIEDQPPTLNTSNIDDTANNDTEKSIRSDPDVQNLETTKVGEMEKGGDVNTRLTIDQKPESMNREKEPDQSNEVGELQKKKQKQDKQESKKRKHSKSPGRRSSSKNGDSSGSENDSDEGGLGIVESDVDDSGSEQYRHGYSTSDSETESSDSESSSDRGKKLKKKKSKRKGTKKKSRYKDDSDDDAPKRSRRSKSSKGRSRSRRSRSSAASDSNAADDDRSSSKKRRRSGVKRKRSESLDADAELNGGKLKVEEKPVPEGWTIEQSYQRPSGGYYWIWHAPPTVVNRVRTTNNNDPEKTDSITNEAVMTNTVPEIDNGLIQTEGEANNSTAPVEQTVPSVIDEEKQNMNKDGEAVETEANAKNVDGGEKEQEQKQEKNDTEEKAEKVENQGVTVESVVEVGLQDEQKQDQRIDERPQNKEGNKDEKEAQEKEADKDKDDVHEKREKEEADVEIQRGEVFPSYHTAQVYWREKGLEPVKDKIPERWNGPKTSRNMVYKRTVTPIDNETEGKKRRSKRRRTEKGGNDEVDDGEKQSKRRGRKRKSRDEPTDVPTEKKQKMLHETEPDVLAEGTVAKPSPDASSINNNTNNTNNTNNSTTNAENTTTAVGSVGSITSPRGTGGAELPVWQRPIPDGWSVEKRNYASQGHPLYFWHTPKGRVLNSYIKARTYWEKSDEKPISGPGLPLIWESDAAQESEDIKPKLENHGIAVNYSGDNVAKTEEEKDKGESGVNTSVNNDGGVVSGGNANNGEGVRGSGDGSEQMVVKAEQEKGAKGATRGRGRGRGRGSRRARGGLMKNANTSPHISSNTTTTASNPNNIFHISDMHSNGNDGDSNTSLTNMEYSNGDRAPNPDQQPASLKTETSEDNNNNAGNNVAMGHQPLVASNADSNAKLSSTPKKREYYKHGIPVTEWPVPEGWTLEGPFLVGGTKVVQKWLWHPPKKSKKQNPGQMDDINNNNANTTIINSVNSAESDDEEEERFPSFPIAKKWWESKGQRVKEGNKPGVWDGTPAQSWSHWSNRYYGGKSKIKGLGRGKKHKLDDGGSDDRGHYHNNSSVVVVKQNDDEYATNDKNKDRQGRDKESKVDGRKRGPGRKRKRPKVEDEPEEQMEDKSPKSMMEGVSVMWPNDPLKGVPSMSNFGSFNWMNLGMGNTPNNNNSMMNSNGPSLSGSMSGVNNNANHNNNLYGSFSSYRAMSPIMSMISSPIPQLPPSLGAVAGLAVPSSVMSSSSVVNSSPGLLSHAYGGVPMSGFMNQSMSMAGVNHMNQMMGTMHPANTNNNSGLMSLGPSLIPSASNSLAPSLRNSLNSIANLAGRSTLNSVSNSVAPSNAGSLSSSMTGVGNSGGNNDGRILNSVLSRSFVGNDDDMSGLVRMDGSGERGEGDM